jgi:hypothetical protein
MIRHDHIPTHSPAITISRRRPFADQNIRNFNSREKSVSICRARRYEVNRLIDPNTSEPSQMLMHRTLL